MTLFFSNENFYYKLNLEFSAKGVKKLQVKSELIRTDGVTQVHMSDFCKSLGKVSCPLYKRQLVTFHTSFKMPFIPQQNQGPTEIRIKFIDEDQYIFLDVSVRTTIKKCITCLVLYILRNIVWY